MTRRELRREAGVCVECGDPLADTSKLNCDYHRIKRNAQSARLRVIDPARYRAIKLKYSRRSTAELREAGKCINCGKSVSKHLRCTACRANNAEAAKLLRKRKKILLARKEKG